MRKKYHFLLAGPHLHFPSFPYSFLPRCYFSLWSESSSYLLLCFLAPKHGTAHDIASFMVFEPLFLKTLQSTALLFLLFFYHITMENGFFCPSFFLSSLYCFSFSLYIIPEMSGFMCSLGTPKESDTSNQVQNFRLLFVLVTLFSNDLPKLLLPVHRQGTCNILSVWLGDNLRDWLFISMLAESKI